MSDLSMSQFVSREEFERAREERMTKVHAEPGRFEATRLVCGVELRLVEEGKHWTISARKV